MYSLVLIFPILGCILSGLLGRIFGRLGSAFLSTLGLFLTMILGFLLFYEVCICQAVVSLKLYNWFLLDLYSVELGLYFDTVSVTMIVVITIISFFVHLYSTAYMSHDPYLSRFMSYLSFFTFFMLVLVTSDNFVQLFIGWEGVGLCSYLLINFWFTRILANKAALKAMVVNRIADVFFTIAIVLILLTFKTTDFIIVFNLLPYIFNDNIIFLNININKINLITFFLFIGAIGKSAQIGFHTWLPDAMEGPTPVSALLHAATMVTAGVFLVIRSSLFFEYSDQILFLLCVFGSTTALFSGFVASFQYDIKKIIAYSTCSQLGYMFFSCGLSNYNVAFFHLFNHAFFKALLFLSAGALIHSLFDEQDIRKMGGLVNYLPFIYLSILVGSLAILGTPFLSGFYSKDVILELTYSRYIIDSYYIFLIAVISALLTSTYSFKLLYFVFFHKLNFSYSHIMFWKGHDTEVFDYMYISLFCLIFFSTLSGYLFYDMFIGYGSLFWNNSIYFFNNHFIFLDIEYIHPIIKNLPIILCFLNMFIFYIIFSNLYILKSNKNLFKILNKFSSFFFYALFFNKIYNNLYLLIFKLSYQIQAKYIDKGILELIGPFGFYKFFRMLHYKMNNFLPSLLFNYLFIFFFSLFFFLVIIVISFNSYFFIILYNIGLIFVFIILIFVFFYEW